MACENGCRLALKLPSCLVLAACPFDFDVEDSARLTHMTIKPDYRTQDVSAPTDSFRAQNGEDRWLDHFFVQKRDGFFVDVGAYDGVNLSNSYYFEQIGWRGLLVEPDPDRAEHCRTARPGSHIFHCAAVGSPDVREITFHQVDAAGVYSTTNLTPEHANRLSNMGCVAKAMKVPARTLDSMLEEVGAPRIDFASIDVEGAEMSVLEGFDIQRWRPAIVVIESNSKVRSAEIRDYFVRNGYAYWHSIDVNDFYRSMNAGPVGTWLVDRSRYAWHRIVRRVSRIASNLRRSWRKRNPQA